MKISKILGVGLVALAVSALAPVAHADSIIALTVSGGSLDDHSNPNDLGGWVFTTSTAINVTSLGMLTQGLTMSHFVGIYALNGQLLMGENVSFPGTPQGAPGSDLFTYTTLASPTTLAAGQYFIGEWYPGSETDPFVLHAGTPSTATGIQYDGFGLYTGVGNPDQNQGSGLDTPANFSEGNAFFGPNFQFTSVPAPGALALLGFGVFGIGGLRRKKQAA